MFDRLHQVLNDENRIEAFEFIRSFAAISVILTHFELLDLYSVDIDAFFMLSGFLIAQILCRDTPMIHQRYIVSRFTKIIPSYLFLLVVAWGVGFTFLKDIYGANLPIASEWKQYFLLYRNYAGLPNQWALEHVWTICVEEHFYVLILVFSLFVANRSKFKSRLKVLAFLLIGGSVLLKTQALATSIAEYPTYTHNRLDAFGFGMLLFLFDHQLRNSNYLKSWMSLVLSIALLFLVMYWDQSAHQLILRIASPILLSLIFISLMQFRFPSVFRILAFYSYNAYLWHFFILIPIIHFFDYSFLGFAVYILMTCMLAFLTTHLIEDTFINRRKAIFQWLFNRDKAINQ